MVGFIIELLVVKKQLFPGGEDEISPAVDTLQHLVLKFHFEDGSLQPVFSRHSRGRRWYGKYRLCTSPLVLPLGLGPPRTKDGAWIQLFVLGCRINDEYE